MMQAEKLLVQPGRQRSFGRTSSRMRVVDQQKLDARLQPYLLDLSDKKQTTFPPEKKLIVEVGVGNGLQLFERAVKNPDEYHLGIEVYRNGLRSLVNRLEKQGNRNLRICDADARDVLSALPRQCVNQLVVLYPDPWPKKKHHKRRLIQKEFLELAVRVLKPGGELFIATDIPAYAFWILREISLHGFFSPVAASPAQWAAAPSWWVSTKYEQKALKEGRFPWYLTFAEHKK